MGRSSVSVSFFCADQMKIEEVVSATRGEDLSRLNNEYLSKFIGTHRSSLDEFDNGMYVCKLDDGNWIEFSMY
jgi:hypothetical protein